MKHYMALVIIVLALSSCYNDKADKLYPNLNNSNTCDTTRTITYSGDIAPIMQQNCALSGCHDMATASNGYEYTDYAGVDKSVINGKLVGCVTWAQGFVQMPQAGTKLPDCSIDKIVKWVNEGAPNN